MSAISARMAAARPPLLSARGLRVVFDTAEGEHEVLDELSLEIARGEVLGVVGESGAGKSMLGKAIAGLIEAPGRLAGGEVWLDGQRIDTLGAAALTRRRGRRIATVFQDPLASLNPVLSIGRHLSETLRVHFPLDAAAARRRAVALLEEVGIADAAASLSLYPHQFSGGMRQRVAIALALCGEPELLIADEPTTALDVSVQAQVIALLRRLCRRRGMALLLISHDLGVIASIADRVLVLRQGRLVEQAPVREILGSPRQPYTRMLMAAIPPLGRRLERLPLPGESADCGVSGISAPRAPGTPLIELKHLSRRFERTAASGWRHWLRRPGEPLLAVQDISLQIGRGQTYGLVGESGSGKSTLARMVAGLTPPSQGQVLHGGVDRWADRQAAARLRGRFQMVFQDPYASLNPRWSVARIIAEPLQVLGLITEPAALAAEVERLLRRVRLPADSARRYPQQLSGGQRQRVAIARALASRPEFIICDEPTSSLDVSVQAQVLNLMRDLQDEFGISYLLISHNLAVIRFMADQVGVMQAGRLVESGPAEAVFGAPRHPYTRALFDAVPALDPPQAAEVAEPALA
ncbi:ABC transporter ATP-binding protein [Roseateles cavernae]|uniref:ABC transporter ATP-binding protein n=1 Tax=Roseateles cavernae TaxID=3153578 RepID=UPI0032E38110